MANAQLVSLRPVFIASRPQGPILCTTVLTFRTVAYCVPGVAGRGDKRLRLR